MATLVIVDAKVKVDSLDKMRALLAEILPDTRTYDGCQGVTAYANLDDPQGILLHELWESRAHCEKYFAWRRETGVLNRIVALLEDPPSIRYLEATDA